MEQPSPSLCTLDAEGFFVRNGRRIFPVGVNYWPAASGLRMWERWDADEIAADLDLIASLGLNTVRFFLRWQDFEPEAGRYDETQFARLDWLLAECERLSLLAHPSLFVGWMSGGIFWPAWKGSRGFFTDTDLIVRAETFAARASAVIARHAGHVLAVDLGNELDCLPDCAGLRPAEISAWCARITAAIRGEFPQALIVSGCDHGQVVNDTPWTFAHQTGTDLLSMHAYPVPAWHPVPLGGLGDPLVRRLFPFYCAYARAHGPVLFQEFGTFLTHGSAPAAFLEEVLPDVAATGVNGMLWWCLHDITSPEDPYVFNPAERSLGLVDSEGRVKPALRDAVRRLASWGSSPERLPSRRPPSLGIFLSRHTHALDDHILRAPNPPAQVGRRQLAAWHLAHENGLEPGFVFADTLPAPGSIPVLIAGVQPHPDELQSLHAWVRAGGNLVWHGVSRVGWSPALIGFLGARPGDYAPAGPVELNWQGHAWTFAAWPDGVRLVLDPIEARVLAADSRGHGLIYRHELGSGSVTYALPQVEDAMLADRARDLAAGERWAIWLRSALFPGPLANGIHSHSLISPSVVLPLAPL
jgi:hypothetical protein